MSDIDQEPCNDIENLKMSGKNRKLPKYLQILKSWFRQKITRDDFDQEARKLLTADSVHLHNQFLLAILTKCQTLSSTLVQRDPNSQSLTSTSATLPKPKKIRDKNKRRIACPRVVYNQRFVPANVLSVAPSLPSAPPPDTTSPLSPDDIEDSVRPPPAPPGPAYVAREMLLPDIGLVHGRTLVTAWDYGLDDVSDDAVKLVLQAVQTNLKDLLTAILCRRKSYHLREKRFRHAFGTERPGAFIQNSALVHADADSEATCVSDAGVHMPSVRPSVETGSCEAAVQTAAGTTVPPTTERVSLYDLYAALQVHKSALPSHRVYTIAMERIINRLHHPSHEELTQDLIHQQEVRLRREMLNQQAVFRI